MTDPSFASMEASVRQSKQQGTFPYNLPVEKYDKFSLINPSQNGDFVIVPIHCYEIFKGIAMEHINLLRNEKL